MFKHGNMGQGIYVDPARDFCGVHFALGPNDGPVGWSPGYHLAAAKMLAGAGGRLVDVSDPKVPVLGEQLPSFEALSGDFIFRGWPPVQILRKTGFSPVVRVEQLPFPSDVESWSVRLPVTGDLAFAVAWRGASSDLYLFRLSPLLKIPSNSLERRPDGSFRFKLSSEPDQVLDIQASDDWTAWTSIRTVTNHTGGTIFTDRSLDPDRRFYRLQLKPGSQDSILLRTYEFSKNRVQS